MKRPKFEELNEYPALKKTNTNWLLVVFLSVVIIGVAYVGGHYWYQCTDWGFFKSCVVIQKP